MPFNTSHADDVIELEASDSFGFLMELPMAILIPVGPFHYQVILQQGLINVNGRELIGACDSNRQIIYISDVPSPAKRLATFWHEVAHAWFAELNPGSDEVFDEETFCNVIGLAMLAWGPLRLARVQIYLTRGIEAKDVLVMPDGTPVPMFTISRDDWEKTPLMDEPPSPQSSSPPSP